MIQDDVIHNGFDSIDDEDLIDWLDRHQAVYPDSPLVKNVYDACFAYANGNSTKPNFGAGTALFGNLLVLFAYRGHVGWKMASGMGDTVFSPLYLVLKNRGVKFHFFQRVTNLGLSAGGKTIEQQATILGKSDYHPLYNVKGLPCWPNQPLTEQLDEFEDLADMESSCASKSRRRLPKRTLKCGAGFDSVILGIPVGVLGNICPELIRASPQWAAMVRKLGVVQTQVFQIWLKRTAAEMGWDGGMPWPEHYRAAGGGYVEPFDSFGDFSHALSYENWRSDDRVRQIMYFSNALPCDSLDPATQTQRVYENAISFLSNDVHGVYPSGTLGTNPCELDWDLLVGRWLRAVPVSVHESEYGPLRALRAELEEYEPVPSGAGRIRIRKSFPGGRLDPQRYRRRLRGGGGALGPNGRAGCMRLPAGDLPV